MAPHGQLHVPKEPSFPIPLKYIGVTRHGKQHLDNFEESSIDGNRTFSEDWIGLTRHQMLMKRSPKCHSWVIGRLTKYQHTARAESVWPESCTHKRGKAKLGDKPRRDAARQRRGLFDIPLEHEDCEDTVRRASRKLEIPVVPEMTCLTQRQVTLARCAGRAKPAPTEDRILCTLVHTPSSDDKIDEDTGCTRHGRQGMGG